MTKLSTQLPASTVPHNTQKVDKLVLALFILSGGCGLAYEVLWARCLGVVLGNTVLLHMSVLGAFMAGLAGGSFYFSSRVGTSLNPLRLYGLLEICLSIYAGSMPYLTILARGTVPHAGEPGSATALAIRIILVICLLIPPAFWMGGTFPALTEHLERRNRSGASGAAWLYAANCFGAAFGVSVVGFALIPSFGPYNATLIVASINVGAALCALFIARRTYLNRPTASQIVGGRYRTDLLKINPVPVCWTIGLSGASAFILELVWTRLFAISMGSSTYSFTIMLAAFISGLAGGALTAATVQLVRRNPVRTLVLCQLLIAAAVVGSIPIYQRLPYWFWQWRWMIRPSESNIWLFHLVKYGLTFAVMAVPTFLFGLSLPAAILSVSIEDDSAASRTAAIVYGCNTAGTIIGVLAGGLALIPLLGMNASLKASAIICAFAAAVLIFGLREIRWPRMVYAAAPFLILLALVLPPWNPLSFALGMFRYQVRPPDDWATHLKYLSSRKIQFSDQDFGTSAAVLKGLELDGHETVLLVVDGKTEASTWGDLPTQILLAQIPMCLRPSSEDVFVVGLGSGVTVGSVLTHPVDRLICAELSRGVTKAAPYFADTNGNALADKRVHLVLDDGRTALSALREKFDIIISEPPNPWVAGVGNLFSTDFYQVAARKLKPGGLFAQWFHIYEFDDRLAASVVHTFCTSFPHAIMFNTCTKDFVLVGSRDPIQPDFAAMNARISEVGVSRDLNRVHISRLSGLLSRQTHGEAATAAFGAHGEINSDAHPFLEFAAPKAQYLSSEASRIPETDERLGAKSHLLLGAYEANHIMSRADIDDMIESSSDWRSQNREFANALLRDAMTRWPSEPKYFRKLAADLADNGDLKQGEELAEKAVKLGDDGAKNLLARIRAARNAPR